MSWREKSYGRLTGGEIDTLLSTFRECWSGRTDLLGPLGDEQWPRALEKLMGVPNWTPFYQDSLIDLIGKMVVVSGMRDAIEKAVLQDRPVQGLLEAVDNLPDVPPDHPAAMPLAFAMLGNLEAIARYSRSINDMIRACREQGDIEALFDALSVDSLISTMPFFQAALRLGQLSGDATIADQLLATLRGPHRKRLIYPELRWAEYLLRDQGAFHTCSREDVYELIVVHLGLYDPSGTQKDPKAALFTLFRAWQKEAGIQKPRFGFSAKGK